MSVMSVCRVCLCNNPRKDVTQLKSTENEVNYAEIMLFCLNIKVREDYKEVSKLCAKCFKKIIDFHKFKSLAHKNDSYFRSIESIKNEDFADNEIKSLNELEIDLSPFEVKEEFIEDNCVLDESLEPDENIKYEYIEDTEKSLKKKEKQSIEPKIKRSRKRKHEYSNEPGICPVCGKQVKHLQEHAMIHLSADLRPKYKCGICSKEYITFAGRHHHIQAKHKSSRKQCQICKAEVLHLKAHMRAMHDPNARQFACQLCDKKFLSLSNVKIHVVQRHTQERAHDCKICDMKFKTKDSLLKHTKRVHEKEKKYQCDVCSKRFFLKERIIDHLRLHNNERPYECGECDRRFVSSSSLKSHSLTHNGIKLQCTLCDSSFIKPAYLRAHMLSHTREKRYQCKYCGAAFHRSDHRKRHERNSHVKRDQLTVDES